MSDMPRLLPGHLVPAAGTDVNLLPPHSGAGSLLPLRQHTGPAGLPMPGGHWRPSPWWMEGETQGLAELGGAGRKEK